jgi:cell division protein FtsL
MGFLKSLLPSKYVIFLVLALIVACGALYMRLQTVQAEAKSVQIELNEANKKIETQKTTIELLNRDMRIERELLAKSQRLVDIIREKAIEDLKEISNTDFGKEANSNAPELERIINERNARLFKQIESIGR